MGREYFLAGVAGYRPDLCYSVMDDSCSVCAPGYDKPVAMLPSDTVDAVFTRMGMLVYKDSRGEVRALQIADHEPVYRALRQASMDADKAEVKSMVTGKPLPTFSQIMGRHTGGMVSGGGVSGDIAASELFGHSPYRSKGTKESMDDAVSRVVIGPDSYMKDGNGNNMITRTSINNATISDARISKLDSAKISEGKISVASVSAINVSSKEVFEKIAHDMVREYVAPLVRDVHRLKIQNAELTAKVREMEKVAGNKPVTAAQPEPSVAPIREIPWGDQGGLPNSIHPQDNPFCGKRRG